MVARETGGGIIVNHNWYSGNDQFFFSKTPLETLADFEGLKTRSHAAALSDWIQGMGAEAQFVAFSEVYTALERGILDAGVTGSTPGHGQRWYEVTDYLNGPLKSLLSTNNVVNADVWNSIPSDLQQIFIEEGAKAELEQLRLTSIQNVTGVQKNVDAGMTLVEFSPELAEHSFNVSVLEHVIPGWLRRVGYPEKGDEAVGMFNEHVGPYVGVSIEADGSVSSSNITKGPHAQ
jgi:TRAP-type C4-dicarboxylate transport system substrate-binding protein